MPNPREEQLRNNRRLARQIVGAVALLLALIGLLTVLSWVGALLRVVLDDSEERQAYEDKLYGLVMLDTRPFADASQTDPTVFREAAIWSTLYQIQKREGNFDSYERDSMTGALILPRLEIDTYLTNLLGPEFEIEDGTFETTEFIYLYDEEKQGYLVPVTGSIGLYMPKVERIFTRNGQTFVTVGYIPTLVNSNDFILTIPTEPVKYMDFVFERSENRQYYLVALQESETQPAVTAAPTEAPYGAMDPQDLVQDNLDFNIEDNVTPPGADDDAGNLDTDSPNE